MSLGSDNPDASATAIGYARASTVEQAVSGYLLQDQHEKIRDYCRARSWDLVRVYADEGASGADSARNGFSEARAVLLSGDARALVVTKLDRLSRSASLMLAVTEELEAAGVGIVSITDAPLTWRSQPGMV
ncbi:MAG: recombinase family protein [Actinomycetota bacterium]